MTNLMKRQSIKQKNSDYFYKRKIMSFHEFLKLLIVGMTALMVCHLVSNGDSMPRWNDIPALASILFGVSPYGQAAYKSFRYTQVRTRHEVCYEFHSIGNK